MTKFDNIAPLLMIFQMIIKKHFEKGAFIGRWKMYSNLLVMLVPRVDVIAARTRLQASQIGRNLVTIFNKIGSWKFMKRHPTPAIFNIDTNYRNVISPRKKGNIAFPF